MDEKVLIKSEVSIIAKKIFFFIIIGGLSVTLLCLFLGIIIGLNIRNENIATLRDRYLDSSYLIKESTLEEYIKFYGYDSIFVGYGSIFDLGFIWFIVHWITLFISAIFALI